MTSREIYIEAARRIAEGKDLTSCIALNYASNHAMDINVEYWNIFIPENRILYELWFGPTEIPENQMARSLALLFMAEICGEE